MSAEIIPFPPRPALANLQINALIQRLVAGVVFNERERKLAALIREDLAERRAAPHRLTARGAGRMLGRHSDFAYPTQLHLTGGAFSCPRFGQLILSCRKCLQQFTGLAMVPLIPQEFTHMAHVLLEGSSGKSGGTHEPTGCCGVDNPC